MKALNFFPKTAYAKKRKIANEAYHHNESHLFYWLPNETYQHILGYLSKDDQKKMPLLSRMFYAFSCTLIDTPQDLPLVRPRDYFVITNKKRVINFFFEPDNDKKKKESDGLFFSRNYMDKIVSCPSMELSEKNENIVCGLLMAGFFISFILGAVGLCILTGGPSVFGILIGAMIPTIVVILTGAIIMSAGFLIALTLDIARGLIELALNVTGFLLGMLVATILDACDTVAAHIIENKVENFTEIESLLAVKMTKQINAEKNLMLEKKKIAERLKFESTPLYPQYYNHYDFYSYSPNSSPSTWTFAPGF